jgi:hypothetical protein
LHQDIARHPRRKFCVRAHQTSDTGAPTTDARTFLLRAGGSFKKHHDRILQRFDRASHIRHALISAVHAAPSSG